MSNNKNGVSASQQLGASFTGRPTQGMLYQQDQVIRQKSEYASLFGGEYEDIVIPTLVDFFDGFINLAYGVENFVLGAGLNFKNFAADTFGIDDRLYGKDGIYGGELGERMFFEQYKLITGRPDVVAFQKNIQDYTSTTYTDGFGNPLDVATLIEKGEYLAAGEAAINSAAQSAPSLVLALINPLAGAVVAGTSTAGAKYAEDIFKRTDQTKKDIIFNSLLAGGSEMLTEYVGGKFLRGLNGIGQTGKQLNKQIVKDYTQGFTQGFFKNVLVGGTGEALTESANAVIQTYGDVRFYGDDIDKKQYISNIINAAIPAFILGGGASGVSTTINKLNQKDKSNLFKIISPNKWKDEYFASAKRVTDLAVDISQTSNPNVKKSLQKDLDNEIKKRDALSEVLNTSFDNLTNKELFKYAKNLDIINNNNSILNNKKLTSTLREKAEKENLKLIQENYNILGTEYNAENIETDQIISSALKSSEVIAERLKKLKGINRKDLDVKIIENQKQIDELKNDPNFDERADGIFIGKNKDGKAEIIINTEKASLAGATNVVGHELLHYMISRQFKTDNASMMPLIGELKNYLKENHTDVFQRVQQRIDEFYTDKDGNIKEEALEEYIEVFSDLISKEKINLKDAESKGLRGKFDSILLGFGLKDVKIETAQDLVRFIKNYTDNINRQGLLGKLMGTKILDARIISSKLVKKDDDTETVQKKSLTAAQKANIKQKVDKLGQVDKDGNNLREKGTGNFYYQAEVDSIIKEIKEKGYLNGLIISQYKVDTVPKNFVNDVITQLTSDIKGFKPEQNESLFDYLLSRIKFRAGDVYNKIYKKQEQEKTAKDVDDRTKEGEVKVQVAAETDARTKAFETEDISPQAEARRKKEAAKKVEPTKSELRQAMGIKDGSDAYNTVLETARKVLIRAYDAGKTARQIQRDLTKEASAYLFKQVKNMLGTKRNYIGNITKFRVPLINSMFTADLVQLERNVPDNEKVFTRFIKNLTSKQEVQDAVDNNLLSPSALNTIDKGQSVALYEKIIPTEEQFIEFFDQPLINPKTGARSGLRGTRKDQLAKYVAASLNYDATMQVAQEPEVAEKRQQMAELRGETMDDTDIQVLSATINRDPSIKFSKSSKPVVDKNLAYHIKEVLRLDNITKQEDFEDYSKDLVFKVPGQGVTINSPMSAKDKALFAREAFRIRNEGTYERNNDRELDSFIENGIEKARKDGKVETRGKILENASKDIVNKNTKGKLTDGNGDIYVDYSGVIFGIEAKGGFAQWVSRTLNAIGDTLSFTTKNDTIDKTTGRPFEEAIIKKVLEVRKDINNFLEMNGLNPIKDFNKPLDVNSKEFEILKIFKSSFQVDTTVSLEYVIRDYILNKYSGNNAQSLLLVDFNAYLMETDSESYRNAKVAVDMFNEGKPVEQQIIPLQLNKETDAITVHISFQVSDAGLMNHRFRPKLDDNQFIKSNVNLFKDAKVAKEFGQALDKAAEQIALTKQSKSAANTRSIEKYSKTSRGMSAFDFDETLIDKGDNFIIATSPSGKEIKITSAQWPIQGSKLAEQGYTFDFKDFVNVRGGVEGPLLQKLRNRIKKYGAKNNYILTARPPASATAIHGWLKTKGINIPLENITGLGNSTGDAKALWITGKYAEGYNDIYFVDDALPNVKAVADVIDQLDIKGKSVQAKVKFSRSVNDQFNDIIEQTTGVETEKRFSDVQANLRSKKGKYFNLVPPSAQDFMGLLYNFLGKGRTGEQQFKFFKKTLIDPFARGINELNTARQRTMEKYMQLVKGLPKVKKQLTTELKKFKDIPSYIENYSVDQAVRVYLWNKNGIEVPGMTKRDTKALTDFVKNNPDIQSFADAVGTISKEQQSFTEPGEYWLTENIKSDLFSDGALGDARSKYLAEWQENVDQMFSPENMNKIKVIYGTKFVEALQDILYRMKTGRNRPTNKSRLTNEWLNWVNGSVGAIMFFNIRSAVLQTISSINYINWSDNNPLKAAAAFANQKQFWKDFSFLFNSDFLKQRRAGNQRGVNEQELSEAVTGKGAFEQAKAAIRYLLKVGFLPTQIADSFAIASGGSTFYRNRIKKYVKDGMTQEQAEKQAFLDFQEITEVSQQSARPDLISQQQADALGRLILSFQNTPMQYGRIMDKAFRDIINRRGDTKTHVSKIAYYGVAQGILFTALQSALFASWGDEDDEVRDKKTQRMLNGIVDSWLSTFGYGGKGIATLKNTLLEYQKQRAKDLDEEFMTRPDHTYTILTALSFSPPIGSKLRKIYSSIQTERFNRDIMRERGFKVDNPAFSAIGNVIEAVTNLPLGRLSNKLRNLENALDSRNETWQRVALVLGWNTWDLGIKDQDIEALGENIKERKKQEKKMEKIKNKYPGKTKEEIDIIIKEKEIFDLSKREQENIIKQNGLNPKRYKLEKDRVNIIMKLRDKDAKKIDKQLNDIKNYKPSKLEQREIDLFKMNKKDQVNLLMSLGLSSREIKKLKYEEDRVKKIIELENRRKSKNR